MCGPGGIRRAKGEPVEGFQGGGHFEVEDNGEIS